MSKEIQLISENYIKTHSSVMSNVDNQMLIPHIFEAQEIDYKNLIGSDLYDRIITEYQAYADSSTAVSTAIVNLVKESQNYLLYRVLTNSIYSLHVKITNKGITEQSSDNSQNVDRKLLSDMETKWSLRAQSMGSDLIDFIDDNISDYPEVTEDCTSSDLDEQYLYLGDEI